jgi:hypothetical protein
MIYKENDFEIFKSIFKNLLINNKFIQNRISYNIENILNSSSMEESIEKSNDIMIKSLNKILNDLKYNEKRQIDYIEKLSY